MDASTDRGPPHLVERKNAEARRLAARGKLRGALDVLNDAIYAAPAYPHLYATRAIVFERMGMYPQAEADRQRALDLAQAGGYTDEEVFADPEPPPPSPPPPRSTERRPPPLPRVSVPRVTMPNLPPMPHVTVPRVSMPPPGSRAELTVVIASIAGLTVLAAVLFFAANALGDSDVNLDLFDFESFQEAAEPSPAASPGAAPEATATAAPTPPAELLAGSPFSYSSLEKAWQGKGITVAPGAVSSGFSGFKANPFDVNLTRGGGAAALSLFVYANHDAPKEEWDLPSGSRPSPKEGRSLPAHETIWWNSNLIVVVRTSSGDIGDDALQAVLNVTP